MEICDLIIHTGDIKSAHGYELIKSFNKCIFVKGNWDRDKRLTHLPEKIITEIDNWFIGIIHGWGSPRNIGQKIYDYFDNPKPNIVLFGHSHVQCIDKINNTVLINHGSFFKRMFPFFPTSTIRYGLLTLKEKTFETTIKIINKEQLKRENKFQNTK